MDTKKFKDIALLSIVVIAIQMLLSNYVYKYLFANSLQQVFGIIPTSLVTPMSGVGSLTTGNKVLAYLGGVLPSLGNYQVWIAMFIGAFALISLGYWVAEQSWAWKGRDASQRLWAILLYGTIALWAVLYVLSLTSAPAISSAILMPLIIGLAVNYFIIAFVVGMVAKQFNFIKI
jgi:hypothetical protein